MSMQMNIDLKALHLNRKAVEFPIIHSVRTTVLETSDLWYVHACYQTP
jgi:hypothetical protein